MIPAFYVQNLYSLIIFENDAIWAGLYTWVPDSCCFAFTSIACATCSAEYDIATDALRQQLNNREDHIEELEAELGLLDPTLPHSDVLQLLLNYSFEIFYANKYPVKLVKITVQISKGI